METVKVEYIYNFREKRIILHKKRGVFYNEVCNKKLFDCHHSDYDRICFMHECKKKLAKQKHLLVNEKN